MPWCRLAPSRASSCCSRKCRLASPVSWSVLACCWRSSSAFLRSLRSRICARITRCPMSMWLEKMISAGNGAPCAGVMERSSRTGSCSGVDVARALTLRAMASASSWSAASSGTLRPARLAGEATPASCAKRSLQNTTLPSSLRATSASGKWRSTLCRRWLDRWMVASISARPRSALDTPFTAMLSGLWNGVPTVCSSATAARHANAFTANARPAAR